MLRTLPGDVGAFETLHRRHVGRVSAYAVRRRVRHQLAHGLEET